MTQSPGPFCRFALLALVVLAWQAPPLQGQEPALRRPWTLTGAVTGLRSGGTSGWVYGPDLGVRRDFGPRWGVQLRAVLSVLGSEPYAGDGVLAVDLGPTLTLGSKNTELGLTAGATGFLVSDRGEFSDGGVGGFAGGHATFWLTRAVGAIVGADVRIGGSGTAYPSLSGGLAVRF